MKKKRKIETNLVNRIPKEDRTQPAMKVQEGYLLYVKATVYVIYIGAVECVVFRMSGC